MKWHDTIKQVATVVCADATLTAIYGSARRYGGSASLVVPSLEWFLVADGESELWAPVVIQFDQWCSTMPTLARSEQRLRRLFHQDLPVTFGGLTMWAQYVDGASLSAPDRDSYYARAIRFEFTPLRDLYNPSPTP